MTAFATIKTEVSQETLAAVKAMAAGRGVSVEQLAGELVRQAAEDEARLVAAIDQGRREIAAGEGLTHEQLVADMQRWKRDRKRAA